jgi:hypothetical protein
MSLNFYTVRLTGFIFLDLRALIFAEAFGYQTDFLIFPSLVILIPLPSLIRRISHLTKPELSPISVLLRPSRPTTIFLGVVSIVVNAIK